MRTITESEHYADEVAREFVPSGDYITTIADRLDRNLEDNYVSLSDAADEWLRENDRSGYLSLSDDTTADVTNGDSIWIDGVQMNVVDLTLAYEKMMWKAQKDLNWWVQSDGTICIGSVRITYSTTGQPFAKCVKCNQTLAYDGNNEYDQQTFVLGCITHGHNHQSKGAWVEVERVERTIITEGRDKGRIAERPYKMRMFFERSRTPIYAPVAERIRNAERDNYQRALDKSK